MAPGASAIGYEIPNTFMKLDRVRRWSGSGTFLA
jgi:hypothetical protein